MAPFQGAFLTIVSTLIFTAKAVFDGHRFEESLITPIINAPCVRIFHRDGNFGCRAKDRDGIVLPLYLLRDSDFPNLKYLDRSTSQVVAIVTSKFLNASSISVLVESGKIGGILVIDDSTAPPNLVGGCYSHDSSAPQGTEFDAANFGLPLDSYPWNKHGSELMQQNFNFPISLLNGINAETAVAKALENRKNSNTDQRPMWMAKMDFYFGDAHLNSEKCLGWTNRDNERSPKCLPIGGQSVWGTFGARDQRPVVLAVAGMDSKSLFHDITSANDAAGSIITVLAAMDALSKHQDALASAKFQIGFTLFQGEEFGFVGSRRFVEDIFKFDCGNRVEGKYNKRSGGNDACLDPMYPSLKFEWLGQSIDMVVAIDQVATAKDFFIHAASSERSAEVLKSIVDVSRSFSFPVSETTSGSFPPSSLTAFLATQPWLGCVLISGYDYEYSDAAFHSQFDRVGVLGHEAFSVDSVVLASRLLATSLYQLADGNMAIEIDVNVSLVAELASCLTRDGLICDAIAPYIAAEASNIAYVAGIEVPIKWGLSPPSFYSSVISSSSGLPLLMHDGQFYSSFKRSWDNTDRLFILPSSLEMWLRAFMSERLGGSTSADGTKLNYRSCIGRQDCGLCNDGPETEECIAEICQCAHAFYHTAIDPDLESESTPGHFKVLNNVSSPIFTEPNWSTIGVFIFNDAGVTAERIALTSGLIIAFMSFRCSFLIAKSI